MRRALVLLALLPRSRSPAAASAPATRPRARGTELTVSRDFGARRDRAARSSETIPAGETVMRLLQRTFEVETRYGGGFVQSIDGVGGGRRGGRPVDWFFYVNGIEADSGAAARRLARRRPRVVGPPRLGRRDAHPGGRRLVPGAVRVRAEGQAGAGADRVRARRAARVRARCATRLEDVGRDRSAASRRSAPRRARRCCGCSSAAGPTSAATRPRAGSSRGRRPPASSRGRPPRATASSCSTPRGDAVRTLGAGAGLVAATSYLDQQPTWVVAGTDDVGRRRRGGRAERDAAARPLRGRGRERPRGAAARCRWAEGRTSAVTYRRRASPLHAARAGVGSLYCVVLAGVALSFEHPLLLGAVLLAVLLAGAGARRRRRGRALAAVGAAVRAADRADQRARRARRPDRDRAARRRCRRSARST